MKISRNFPEILGVYFKIQAANTDNLVDNNSDMLPPRQVFLTIQQALNGRGWSPNVRL